MRRFLKIVFGTFAVLGLAIIGLLAWAGQQIDGSAQASPTVSAPHFKFRTLQKGTTLAEAKSAHVVKNCNEYEGQTTCDLSDDTFAGAITKGSGVYFDRNGVFSGLDVFIYQNRFTEVSDALTSAYGKTCEFDAKRLHNAFNAEFLSIEASWCFDGGALSFVERSRDDLTTSTLSFGFYGPQKSPKKFTPSEL